ncbi:hypothetical protein [Faecalibacter bovis]|uniref:Uncharacterized protein n=1 Tax=Faecalibacter bovis TaxID=2898187 RepID=A0ABX7XAA3_9FLAO|nr:hypothetical protein [Faecalibacter bovis]MBS7333434.1 hypothetical protein [Weeksellaceae bacterium]QTV04836.1 hypothetical protein J9309_08495 [Faecalibacter bovis]
MEIVSTLDEVLDNVDVFLEGLEMGSEKEITTAIEMVKAADTFLAIITEDVNIFVPSSFIGYTEQSLNNYDKNKHSEKEVNDVLTKIIGSTPKIDKLMDELFLDFCDEIEVNRNDVGLSREYWIIKNL